MPRRTPVKELQQEEPIPGSPLRRSSRLTNTNSSSTPVPPRVLTRRNSSSETASTPTPKVTRGRRSSLSQENQSEEPEKKKSTSTVRTRRNSLQPDEPEETLTPRPKTRASSVTKEVEPKKTPRRRRSVTDDSESDEPTRKSTRSRSTSSTKKDEASPSLKKVSTPAKKGAAEQTNGLEEIEENSNESTSPEKEKLVKGKKKNTDLDLSVIKEASFAEDEKSPKKQTEDELAVNGHSDSKSKSSPKVVKNTVSDSNKLFDSSADSSFKLQLSSILDSSTKSTKESDVDTNKENVQPDDEVEPMEVDQTVLNSSSKSLNTSAKNASIDLESLQKETDDAASSLDKEIELAFETEENKKNGTEAEVEKLASPVNEENGLESPFEEYTAEDNQPESQTPAEASQKKTELEKQSPIGKENVAETQVESQEDEDAFHDEIQSDVESLKIDDDKQGEADLPKADTTEEKIQKLEEDKETEDITETENISQGSNKDDEPLDVFDSEEEGYKSPVKKARHQTNEGENSKNVGKFNIDSKYYAMISPKEKKEVKNVEEEEEESDSDSNVVIELSEEETVKDAIRSIDASLQGFTDDSETEKTPFNTSKSVSLNNSKKAVLNTSKNASLNTSKRAALNTSKNTSLNTSKDSSLRTLKDTSLNTSKNASLNTSKNASLNTSKNDCLNTSKNASLTISKDASPSTSKHDSLNTSKHAFLNTSKHAFLNTSKDVSLKTSKNASLNTSKRRSVDLTSTGEEGNETKGKSVNTSAIQLSEESEAEKPHNVSLNTSGNLSSNTKNTSKNLSLNSSNRLSLDAKSITMQEVVKAGEDLENTLTERIHKAVGLLCTGIKNDADISLNVSLEYTGQSNEAEDDEAMAKIEVAVTTEPIAISKGSKRRKVEIAEESDEESDEETVKAVSSQKASPEKRRRTKSELSFLSLVEPSAESSPKVCFDASTQLESPKEKSKRESMKQPPTPFRRVSSTEDVEEESSDSEEESEDLQTGPKFTDLLTADFEDSDIQDTTWNPIVTDSDTDCDSEESLDSATIEEEESQFIVPVTQNQDQPIRTILSEAQRLYGYQVTQATAVHSSSSDTDKEPAKPKKTEIKKLKQGNFKSTEAVVAPQKAEVPNRKRKTGRIMDDEVSSSKMKKIKGQKKEDNIVLNLKPSVGKTKNAKPLRIKPSTKNGDGWKVTNY